MRSLERCLTPGEHEFRSMNHVPGRIDFAASSATAPACEAVTAEMMTSAFAVSADIEPTASTRAFAACAFMAGAAAASRIRMSHAPTQPAFCSTKADVKIFPTSP